MENFKAISTVVDLAGIVGEQNNNVGTLSLSRKAFKKSISFTLIVV